MADVPKLPTPEVENLRRATVTELTQEVITLRLYVAQLYIHMNDFIRRLGELTGDAPQRLLDAESDIIAIRKRVLALEVLNDERSRSGYPG